MNKLKTEASIVITAIVAFLTEIIGLLVAFGIDVSQSQQTAIIATVTSAAAVIALVGPIIRQFVYSQHTTQKLVDRAADTQNTDIGTPPTGK